jgi:hypothetical protein
LEVQAAFLPLALACLKARIGFANHINFASAAHDLAIAVAGFGGFE